MELQKIALHCQRPVALETVCREESAECIVPDSQPDIDRILDVRAVVLVRDREADVNAVRLRCTVRVSVLYAAENDAQVYCLEVPVAYTHTVQLRGVQPRDEIAVTARVVQADARLINSRRVSVRTAAALRIAVWREGEEQIACGAQEEELCVRTQEHTLACTAAVRARSFTLAQDIELDADVAQAKQVLCADLSLEALETKLLAGRATVRAQGTVRALYRSPEGTLCPLEKSFTFTQSADLPDAPDECALRVSFSLRAFDLECAVDMSGESRCLSLSAGVTMVLEAVEQKTVGLLEDMYGLRRAVSFTCRELGLHAPGTASRVHAAVSETLEAAAAPARIVCVRAEPDLAVERADGEICTSGALLSVIYEGTDGALYGASRRVELRFEAPGIDARTALVSAGPVTASPVPDGVHIELDAVLSGEVLEQEKISVIDEAQWGEPYPSDPRGLSALVMRMPQGQSVWEIARRFHTTAAAIEAGSEGADLTQPGALILIPL